MTVPRSRKLNTGNTEIVEKQVGDKIIRKKVIKAQNYISKTGVILKTCYCRKCMKNKNPDDFYEAVDQGLIDANGKMSVCKDCCNSIFENIYQNSEGTIESAVLKVCRYLNIMYSPEALRVALEQVETMENNGKNVGKFFGIYKAKLYTVVNSVDYTQKAGMEDFTFREPVIKPENISSNNVPNAYELKMRWGDNLDMTDYIWLETELSEWKKTHKCDTKAEVTLLEQICLTELAIRGARSEGRAPGALIKELQDLMKTANLDPAKTSVAGSGKSQDTYSAFIKTIEENEPAEYFTDKKLFKDFDNLDFYFKTYITRPLQNFVTQSRNFDVTSEEEDFDESSGDDLTLG